MPIPLWGFCGEQMKSWGGGSMRLHGVAGSQPQPQRYGEAALSAQSGPGHPYLAPSLGQAVCLSVWGRLDSGYSHAKLGSDVCLLPTPGGEDKSR